MINALILVDGASRPPKISNECKVIELQTYGRNKNVRIEITALRTGLLNEIPKRLDDLISIASILYSVDNRIKRGTEKDVFGERWARNISLRIPVHDYKFWQGNIKEYLTDTLRFLTEDNWDFHFEKKLSSIPVQRFLFKGKIGDLPNVTTILPFSGGVDSLAAAIETTLSGMRPLLISHRASPVISNRQTNLGDLLRNRFDIWPFPHISMWVNRVGGRRAYENTQRSRAFLYSSLAVVAASVLEIDDIRLCDNGIVSINLPQSGQTVGSYSTRSTHPKFIANAQELFRMISGRKDLSIKNPFLFHTKKEVMEIILKSGHPHLLQEAVSCAHSEGMTIYQPHCGVCSQCIDRRFSSIAAGMQSYDLSERYEKDIFTADLKEGIDRTYAENYIRFANKLDSLSTPDMFFNEYPQLYECLGDVDIEETAFKIFEMFQRHQRTTNNVIEKKIKEHAADIVKGTLPENSLIKLVATGKHLSNLQVEYINKLRTIFEESIPPAFTNQLARNEIHVQDIGQAALIAAKERLNREAPQIPFATITTKPDFSAQAANGDSLFIEFKYIKERKRLNSINTEITSRVTIYRYQGAWALFVVYDPNRSIREDQKFIDTFEKFDKIFVSLVR